MISKEESQAEVPPDRNRGGHLRGEDDDPHTRVTWVTHGGEGGIRSLPTEKKWVGQAPGVSQIPRLYMRSICDGFLNAGADQENPAPGLKSVYYLHKKTQRKLAATIHNHLEHFRKSLMTDQIFRHPPL